MPDRSAASTAVVLYDRRVARLLVSITLVLIVVACTGAGGASPGASSVPSASPAPTASGGDPRAETPPAVSVVPQAVLDGMLEQASDVSSVPVSDLTVESQLAVTWPDGSLGCPEPDMMYTQVLVEGYRVIIRARDKTYDFRGSGTEFRLCPGGRGGPSASIEIPPPIR